MSTLSLAPTPLRRLADRVRTRGLGATLAKGFADHVYRRSSSVIVEYRRGWGDLGRPFVAPEGYTFAIVEPGGTLPPLGAFLAPRRADFAAMLAAGKVGVFVSDESGAIACAWIALSDHRDPGSREFYPVAPGEAYNYCWLLDPAKRRSPVGMAICRCAYAWLHARGITRQFVVIDRVNRTSYMIQRRFGFRECGVEVIHLYLLHTRWTWTRRYTGELGLLPTAGRA